MQVYEVGQVTDYIKQLLEYDEAMGDLWIHGEITSLSRSPSGHIYFSLKDGQSQLKCAFFKSSQRRIALDLRNGLSILAHGRVSFYESQGSLQFYVDTVQPEGVGQLYLEFEALRARLEAEGLFAPERKRPLPTYPVRIGLVTSITGAVVHDFLTVVGRRYPLVEIVLCPSSVQGDGAPAEMAASLAALNRCHQELRPLDLIVVARGGGSMEDLASFNNEGLARAIFASGVPVVSAVGHETDYTIADFVADLRAPTPSAAAEMVTPNLNECRMQLANLRSRLIRQMQDRLDSHRTILERMATRMERYSPSAEIEDRRRGIEELIGRAHQSLAHRLRINREQLNGSVLRLEALSPLRILERGYCLCLDPATGRLVRSRLDVEEGDGIQLRVADGRIDSVVVGTRGPNGERPENGRQQPATLIQFPGLGTRRPARLPAGTEVQE